jgi:hypothetical protein
MDGKLDDYPTADFTSPNKKVDSPKWPLGDSRARKDNLVSQLETPCPHAEAWVWVDGVRLRASHWPRKDLSSHMELRGVCSRRMESVLRVSPCRVSRKTWPGWEGDPCKGGIVTPKSISLKSPQAVMFQAPFSLLFPHKWGFWEGGEEYSFPALPFMFLLPPTNYQLACGGRQCWGTGSLKSDIEKG